MVFTHNLKMYSKTDKKEEINDVLCAELNALVECDWYV